MTSPDAPSQPPQRRRDARPAPYGPATDDALTTALRRLYVDTRRRPHTPPTATGYMGRFRTTRLRTAASRTETPLNAPLSQAHIHPPTPHRQPPDAEGEQTPVLCRGVGAPCSRPLYGRPVPYRAHIQAVIEPDNVRGARRRPQDPWRPPVAPQGRLPKPEIEGAECQETPHPRCQTENPYSGGSQGGLNRRRKPPDGAGVSSPEPSGVICHPPDMDTLLAPETIAPHGAAVGDSRNAEIPVRTVRWP